MSINIRYGNELEMRLLMKLGIYIYIKQFKADDTRFFAKHTNNINWFYSMSNIHSYVLSFSELHAYLTFGGPSGGLLWTFMIPVLWQCEQISWLFQTSNCSRCLWVGVDLQLICFQIIRQKTSQKTCLNEEEKGKYSVEIDNGTEMIKHISYHVLLGRIRATAIRRGNNGNHQFVNTIL